MVSAIDIPGTERDVSLRPGSWRFSSPCLQGFSPHNWSFPVHWTSQYLYVPVLLSLHAFVCVVVRCYKTSCSLTNRAFQFFLQRLAFPINSLLTNAFGTPSQLRFVIIPIKVKVKKKLQVFWRRACCLIPCKNHWARSPTKSPRYRDPSSPHSHRTLP